MGLTLKKEKARLEFISKIELKGGSNQLLTLFFFSMYLIAKLTITALYDFLDNT